MQAKLAQLERMVAAGQCRGRPVGKPAAWPDQCLPGYWKSPDYFIRNCPVKAAKDATKKLDDAAAAAATI